MDVNHHRRLHWLRGLLFFLLTMLACIFVGGPLQYRFGIWGLLYTELIILISSILAVLVMKIDIRDALPVRVPKLRQIIGVVLMVAAGGVLASCSAYVGYLLHPEGLAFIDTFLRLSSGIHPFTTWLIVALMPAVCEEFMHRGVILYAYSHSVSIGKWSAIGWTGILFGLFHLDLTRFAVTAIIGMILSYIMLETRNFVLPILYHLLNNSISVLSSVFTPAPSGSFSSGMDRVVPMLPTAAGTMLILASGAVFVLRLGAHLMRPSLSSLSDDEKIERIMGQKKTRILTVFVSILLFASGYALLMSSAGEGL